MAKNLIPATLIIIFLIFEASAVEFGITPENPVKGDVVKIYGRSAPQQKVAVKVSFEKEVNAVGGQYEWKLYGVSIPVSENCFTVRASNVENLGVSVKLLLLWVTKSAVASDGVAVVSQCNVPVGNYDVKIFGRAEGVVSLRIEAVGYVRADDSGYFELSYATNNVPSGEFEVEVEGVKKVVRLSEQLNEAGVAGSGSGAAVATTATTATAVETPTETVAATTTETIVESPTPSSSPSPSPSLPPSTAAATAESEQVQSTLTVTQTTSENPKTWKLVGFEAILVVMSLLCAAWLLRRS